MLDGWRGISILAVLACHMLPLGPNHWDLNVATGIFGMAIFFSLSGFLIASTLFFHPSVRDFAIRRSLRILPVAWLFLLIVLPAIHADSATWRADLLFYTNLPPYHLSEITGHFWSLCVEVQFYVAIALAFLAFGRRSLALLPVFCVAITTLRACFGHSVDIVTIYRVDEIFSGASLAYLFHSHHAARLRLALGRISPWIPLVLLALASHPALRALNYLRPYFAAALVGTTLFHTETRWSRVLTSKPLAYTAGISYALYIWHPLTTHGWFDPASKVAKYARRPLGIALSFLLAHISTRYFEQPFIALGKRLTRKPKQNSDPEAVSELMPLFGRSTG
jgi:peptidoglycan/LPS O-acetylase OafA/YrhL